MTVAADPLELHAAGAPAWRIMEAIEQRRRQAPPLAPPAPAQLEHRPHYVLCSAEDPSSCCGTSGPLAILCALDGEGWPCTVNREHHTDAYSTRTARWVAARIERSHTDGW